MRVGVLTSYEPHEIGVAWATLPVLKRYCHTRGYSLVVGIGMSVEGLFDEFAPQFETAMLFLPIRFVVLDPSIRIEHRGARQTEPPPNLGIEGKDLLGVRWLIAENAF